jgi:hypothetical protein
MVGGWISLVPDLRSPSLSEQDAAVLNSQSTLSDARSADNPWEFANDRPSANHGR